jgi:protein-S-isoprenylcysteine O-methyltransferase Ste14
MERINMKPETIVVLIACISVASLLFIIVLTVRAAKADSAPKRSYGAWIWTNLKRLAATTSIFIAIVVGRVLLESLIDEYGDYLPPWLGSAFGWVLIIIVALLISGGVWAYFTTPAIDRLNLRDDKIK